MIRLIAFGSLVLLGACASKKSPELKQCINQKNADFTLSKLIPVIDRMGPEHITKLKLVSDQCWKRIYSKNGGKLVMHKKPGSEEVHLSTAQDSGSELTQRACLQKAIAEVKALDPVIPKRIVELNQKKQGVFFSDPDVGAVVWLKCQSQDPVEWSESVEILLHELNHGNSDKDCVYSPFQDQQLCFQDIAELPLRSLGEINPIPVSDKRALEKLQTIQKIYLTDTDQNVSSLLDELNSYTITIWSFNQMVSSTEGIQRLYRVDGSRAGILLPFFQAITINYLAKLYKQNPTLFKKTWVENSNNRMNLQTILAEADKEYASWVKTLASVGKQERDAERELRKDYEQRKKKFQTKIRSLGLKL